MLWCLASDTFLYCIENSRHFILVFFTQPEQIIKCKTKKINELKLISPVSTFFIADFTAYWYTGLIKRWDPSSIPYKKFRFHENNCYARQSADPYGMTPQETMDHDHGTQGGSLPSCALGGGWGAPALKPEGGGGTPHSR